MYLRPASRASAHLASGFSPRPAQIVEDLKQAERVEQAKAERKAKLVEVITSRVKGETEPAPLDPDIGKELEKLVAFIAKEGLLDGPSEKEAKKLVDEIKESLGKHWEAIKPKKALSQRDEAFALLTAIGRITPHENLKLIRYDYPLAWSDSALDTSHDILNTGMRQLSCLTQLSIEREDLTHLKTFTIDDEDTQDIDDAVSVEANQDGFLIGIHITDLANFLPPNTLLDREARSRGSSVYCPEASYHMLPNSLAKGFFSLSPEEVRACISLIVQVNPDLEVQNYRLVHSLIRSTQRVSYDKVDQLLEQQNDSEANLPINLLSEFSSRQHAIRIQNGAINLQRPDIRIIPPASNSPSDSPELSINDSSTPARQLVAELMILYNTLIADFAQQNQIPMPFRSQEAPEEEEELDDSSLNSIPEGRAREFAHFSKLKKSEISTVAKSHFGLGLDYYCQATSPIRRYLDLVAQRQICSFMTNQSCFYSEEELKELIMELGNTLGVVSSISREQKRYWLLEYLRHRRKKNRTIEGIVLRSDQRGSLVELDEVYTSFFTKAQLPIGSRTELQISAVNPRGDYIQLNPS